MRILMMACVASLLLAVVPATSALAAPPEAPNPAEPAKKPAPEKPKPPSCTCELKYDIPCTCLPCPPPPPIPKYCGPVLCRSKITGDWCGTRTCWARCGFTADFEITHVTQALASGGREGPLAPDTSDVATVARNRLTLGLNTERANLWRGGSFNFIGDLRAGEGLFGKAPSLGPSNAVNLVPLAANDVLALTELTYTQFFSGQFAIQVGWIYAINGDPNQFAHGDGSDKFLNFSFCVSPMYNFVIAPTNLGANFIYLPTGNPKDITGTLSIMNAANAVADPFTEWEGIIAHMEWGFGYECAKLPGRHKFGFTYAHNPTYKNLDRRFPNLPVGTLAPTKKDTWSFDYNWWQYLCTYDRAPGKGWGVFARMGVSDGNPNPYHFTAQGGFGGELPWRVCDTFGIGVYYIKATDAPVLTRILDNEIGFEAWYNFQATPWLHITLDMQIIDSAIPEAGTPILFALRTHWDF